MTVYDENLTLLSGFATNAGLPFKTPEEFFRGQKPTPVPGVFNPRTYIQPDPGEPGTWPIWGCSTEPCSGTSFHISVIR